MEQPEETSKLGNIKRSSSFKKLLKLPNWASTSGKFSQSIYSLGRAVHVIVIINERLKLGKQLRGNCAHLTCH
ncbi:hypothetical protein HUJ05_004656 [Dendroctonus ponderosae]|nr:hypothetical protein HUJ05_004656 [Dendroctonus ponderosae]